SSTERGAKRWTKSTSPCGLWPAAAMASKRAWYASPRGASVCCQRELIGRDRTVTVSPRDAPRRRRVAQRVSVAVDAARRRRSLRRRLRWRHLDDGHHAAVLVLEDV